MATATPSRQLTYDPVEATVMAIREKLMGYYKQSSTKSVVRGSEVRLCPIDLTHARYNYQRLSNRQRNSQLVLLHDEPILLISSQPDELTTLLPLDRSPQLQAVRAGVENFMATYLGGIPVTHSTKRKINRHLTLNKLPDKPMDDSDLLTAEPRIAAEGSSTSSASLTMEQLEEYRRQIMERPTITFSSSNYTTFGTSIANEVTWTDVPF